MLGGYDDETDVLTERGWKPWPKVGKEIFGTLSPVLRTLEYQKATQVLHAEYRGPMYRVHSEQVDLLVAPDQPLWVKRHDTQAAKRGEQLYGIEPPQDVLHKRVRYRKVAGWRVESQQRVEIPPTVRSWFAGTQRTCALASIRVPNSRSSLLLGSSAITLLRGALTATRSFLLRTVPDVRQDG